MTYDEFILTIETNDAPAAGLPPYIQALWWDGKDNWKKAHSLIDALDDKNSCRVHAYLHRKEGDSWNAGYWYRRAGTQTPAASLEEEWKTLVMQLLLQ